MFIPHFKSTAPHASGHSDLRHLFNFYNTFVDLNGVAALTPAGYEASGVRLSAQGYLSPAAPTASSDPAAAASDATGAQ